MYTYERDLYKRGFEQVLGLDEVGRGPLAGPLVVAGVILDRKKRIAGLNDSKKLSEKKRNLLYDEIMEKALFVDVQFIQVEEIDQINVLEATKKAMRIIIERSEYDFLLIDAVNLGIENSKSIIKGDTLSASIAAASIIAKVTRDRYMDELHLEHPEYDFIHNKGYGTKKHMEALEQHGILEGIHRKSFAPIQKLNQISFDF
jgi:ribonuclease HII